MQIIEAAGLDGKSGGGAHWRDLQCALRLSNPSWEATRMKLAWALRLNKHDYSQNRYC
jgi:hypothetical protein